MHDCSTLLFIVATHAESHTTIKSLQITIIEYILLSFKFWQISTLHGNSDI